MNVTILGGGINGLICAYYHKRLRPDDKITLIGKHIGGQMTSEVFGPRILHDTPSNRQLVKDLGIERTKIVTLYHIGYYVNGKMVDSIPENLIRAYYKKSRCLETDDFKVPDSAMSEKSQTIQGVGVKMEKVMVRLVEEAKKICTIYEKEIGRIDPKGRTIKLSDGQTIKYDILITTLPANVFAKLAGLDWGEFVALPKCFVRVQRGHYPKFDFNPPPNYCDYNYVYVPDPGLPYHRVQNLVSSSILEYTGEKNFPGTDQLKGYRHTIIPNAQLLPVDGKLPYPADVFAVGRYAYWDHSIKINDVTDMFYSRIPLWIN